PSPILVLYMPRGAASVTRRRPRDEAIRSSSPQAHRCQEHAPEARKRARTAQSAGALDEEHGHAVRGETIPQRCAAPDRHRPPERKAHAVRDARRWSPTEAEERTNVNKRSRGLRQEAGSEDRAEPEGSEHSSGDEVATGLHPIPVPREPPETRGVPNECPQEDRERPHAKPHPLV